MAPAAVILKQRNGLSIYANTPATDKFISIESLASLLQSTITILRPRIVAAPNNPIVLLTVTNNIGTPVDIEFISESKLPGLLSFATKAPTPTSLSLAAIRLLQALARVQFSLVTFTENFTGSVIGTTQGSGTSGEVPLDPAATNENIDDRVNSLIAAGSGLTKVYDDVAGIITLSSTGGGGLSQVKVLNNIFTDLALEPIATGAVSCLNYWPTATSKGQGGLFVSRSTGVVDNVNVFAASDGFWHRVAEKVTMDNAGAVGSYAKFAVTQNPLTNFVPNIVLSDKFPTLAAAQAWYPGARVLALTESLASAALQHALTIAPVYVGKAAYWFNKPIEYFSGMRLVGEGIERTYFVFSADNAFKPRRSLNGATAQDEIYKRGVQIERICCLGTAVPVANNSDDQTAGNTVAFDESKSGFYLPRRNPDLAQPEALDATPLFYDCDLANLKFDRFAGHGLSVSNGFNYRVTKCTGDNNKGYGLHFIDGNSVRYSDNYVGNNNSIGGHWAEGGGTLENCNGIDCLDNRPGVVFGKPGSPQKVNAVIRGGNIEGTGRCVDLHGDASTLFLSKVSLQWHLSDANYPPIRSHGGVCTIMIDVDNASYSGSSPIKTKPNNLLWVTGNNNRIIVLNLNKFLGSEYTYFCAALDGSSVFGLGAGDNRPLHVPGLIFPGLVYGEQVLTDERVKKVPKLYINNQTFGTVDITTALPTTSANPGLYVNINTAATVANKMFIKIGTDANGWKAL